MDNNIASTLYLKQLQLKNFRCFDQLKLDFHEPIVLIQGANGTGKTSILEALYYACHLRSFRTPTPRELIQLGKEAFFVKVLTESAFLHELYEYEIQAGFSDNKRLIKIDQKVVDSYKDVIGTYRVVNITEDDLALIKGYPEHRRMFIDQALVLCHPAYVSVLKEYKKIKDNRHSLLQGMPNKEEYLLWTEQLWHKSRLIQTMRNELLSSFAVIINDILSHYFGENFSIAFAYNAKLMPSSDDFTDFLSYYSEKYTEELRFKRSLFGAHLDDFDIIFQEKRSKVYGSRGQQKLVVVLLKIALIKHLWKIQGAPICVFDDFMTDFDQDHARVLVSLLAHLPTQLIFTSPMQSSQLFDGIVNTQKINLTI
jgi:DNA replication and repair protein RecF